MSYSVITRTTINNKDAKAQAISNAQASKPIFEKQTGLKRMVALLSENEDEICTYFEWESRQNHLDCMQSPDFIDIMKEWNEMLESGAIDFAMTAYSTLENRV